MRMTLAALLLLAAAPAFAPGAFAQTTAPDATTAPPPSGSPAPAMGRPRGVTRDQFVQRATQNAGRRFDEMDTNHDGILERSEVQAWRQAHATGAAANPPITVHSAPASQ
jgi:hypothetical protein